jgi:hypothetical protein
MKKSEREIIRLFSKLSVKKRNRVSYVLNDMSKEKVEREKKNKKVEVYDVENALERTLDSLIEFEDDGTHGDCNPNPRVTKKQLDRELDEYMAVYPGM